jgi:hypothetical protein
MGGTIEFCQELRQVALIELLVKQAQVMRLQLCFSYFG